MNLNRESHVNEVGIRARLFDQAEFEVKIRNPLRAVPKVVPYEAGARDADGDGLVQEGTIWERPAGSRFLSKLGEELAAGLRSIPSASRLVDGDGNDIDYKPGDRSVGARGREGRLARRGQRRLRRADRRLARADRQEARASEIENLDELIARIDAAVSEGSRERLLAAEAARGDHPMDEDYRGFWDGFIEGFSGVKQRDGDPALAAVRKALRLEGERRQAGDAAGNEPDWEREAEFDEIGLPDGVDLEEHERRLREDPEYREAFINSLIEGEVVVPGQEEAAEEATEDVAEAVEDLVPESADRPGTGVTPGGRPGDHRPGQGQLINVSNATDEQIAQHIRTQEGLRERDRPGAGMRPIDGDTRSHDPDYYDRLIAERDSRAAAEEATEARRRAAEFGPDDLPETPESQGGGPPDPEADLPDEEPERVRMRPEAMEYLLTQADQQALWDIITDNDSGFEAAGLRIDNMDTEMRQEWRQMASLESRRRTIRGMSDEEIEEDRVLLQRHIEERIALLPEGVSLMDDDEGRRLFNQRYLILQEQSNRRDANATPEGRGYEFTGQDPNNPWENFDVEADSRRQEIIRNLSPEERQQIIDSAAGMRAEEHLGPDGTDVLAGWPEAAGPEPMDEEGVYVAAAYAEEFQRYNNFVGEGDLAARLQRDGAGGVAPATPESQGGGLPSGVRSGDEIIMDGIRHQIELGVDGDIDWTEAEVQRFVQAVAEEPEFELERLEHLAEAVENAVDVQDGLVHGRLRRSYQARLNELRRLNVNPERGDTDPRQDTRDEIDVPEGVPAIKFLNWDSPNLDPESRRQRRESIASLNDKQRAQILNDEWPTEALGPRPNQGGVSRAKRYVRMHMGDEGREAGRPEDLGDGLEELDRSGLAERIIAAVQADPVGDNEDRDLMRRFADRHGELMAEMEGDDVNRYHRERMEILANMDDDELAEWVERQRNHILNFDDSGDVLRRRTAASELARAIAMRNGREAFDEGVAEEPVIDRLLVDADGVPVPEEHGRPVNQMDHLELRDEMQVLRNNYDNQPNIPDWVARRYNDLWDEQAAARPMDPEQPRLRGSGGMIVRHPDRLDAPYADDRPEGVVDQPDPETPEVATDISPVGGIRQQNRRLDSNPDAVYNYKVDIKKIQRAIGMRNGRPTRRNDGFRDGVAKIEGHEANVDRALLDIDRRLALLPRGQRQDERRKLQGIKRSLRNLKENKLPAERQRRQERIDAQAAQRRTRHQQLVAAHREVGAFNRGWDEADLDDAVANNMDDEAVLARIVADEIVLNQHLQNLRPHNWDPDEGEAPSDFEAVAERGREILAALHRKKEVVQKRQIFRMNRDFVNANEPRFREIERHINNMPEDADVPMEMARDLIDIQNGILDRAALPRMGANNPDPDLQALIDRKVALESDINSLVRANEQRVHAQVVREVLDEFEPRIREIRNSLDNADEAFENQVDVHLAEVQEILNELENLPRVSNLATLQQRREESKAAMGQLHQDLISYRRNVALGDRVDPVDIGNGVVHNPDRVLPGRLGGGANPRPRPAGLGLPGHIDDQGNVVIDSVPVGHYGMNVQLDADRHVRGGGDLSDVPDAFLGNAILNNAAGLTYPDGESNGPARADNATIGDDRFLLVAANKGNIGTTYVLAQRRPDGTVGREGVFIKISKHGSNRDNGDYDALAELVGIEIAHRMGLPTMPGREDGEMLGRGRRQNGLGPAAFATGETGRAIVLEHAWNGAEDFDDVDLSSGFNLATYSVEMQDAMLEGRVGHMMLNWFLGVSDRHHGNGMINIEKVTDANGNETIKGHVYPADLARIGRASRSRVNRYANSDFSMDHGILNDIRRVVAADPARKEALREQVTEMLSRLQEMINDPNLRERMVNRQEYLAGVDQMRQALNSQFDTVAPNGVLPVDEILSDLGLV
jgi:hypothetical protein